MSRRPSARELHEQHEDVRNEVAFRARHEQEIRRRERARWFGSLDALQNTSGKPAEDWDGCVD